MSQRNAIGFAPPIWTLDKRECGRQRLRDPRVLMFSCADLGGTDGADDWMIRLIGGGDKYSPLGLHVYHSQMANTHRIGTLQFAVSFGERRITEWGNIDCCQAHADRVVMSTPFWGNKELAASIEVLMLGSGCCRLGVNLRNQSDRPQPVEVHYGFHKTDFECVKPSGQTLVSGDDWSILLDGGDMRARTLEPGQDIEFSLLLASGKTQEKAQSILADACDVDLDKFRKEQAELSEPDSLDQFAEENREFASAIYNALRTNVIQHKGTFFTAPNRVVHKGQWLWDSCFHAFAWSLFDKHRTAELLENLFTYQDEGTGFIPISIDDTQGIIDYATQPPLIAMAVDRLVESTEIRERLYPKLTAFYKWFEENRRLPNGLYQWKTAGESGMDNSPRFDDDPNRPTAVDSLDFCCRRIEQPIAHIDISSMMVQFAESMANLAASLQRDEDIAQWNEKAQELRKSINEILYRPEDGFYYDRHSDGTWRLIKTVASFWPLAAGVCEPSHAKALVQHLMNPSEFLTPLPIPSVAVDEPSFCFNYWRGPVWINTCYATILGLQRYGFSAEATEIGKRVVEGVKAEYLRSGQIYELYDPMGGPASSMRKKYYGPRENAMLFGGWTANVLNVLQGMTMANPK